MTTTPITIETRHALAIEALTWTKADLPLEQIGNQAIVAALTLQDRGNDGIAVLRIIRNGLRLAGNSAAVDYINDQIHDALWCEDETEPMWA